jgi:hypothetical protein
MWKYCQKLHNYLCIWFGSDVYIKPGSPVSKYILSPVWTCDCLIYGAFILSLVTGCVFFSISVSEDSKLRQSTRQAALREPRLLDSIGTAQMEQDIQKRMLAVMRKTRDLMTEETGVQSSLNEDDMKQYLQQVIEEVKKTKNHSTEAI